MRLNVVVTGFESELGASVIKQLEQDEIVDVKLWMGFSKENTETKIQHRNQMWWWDIFYGKVSFKQIVLSQREQDYFLPKIQLFEQHMAREKLFELVSAYEMRNAIFRMLYFFRDRIERNLVDLILFDDVPHGPYNFLLYHVAKMLGVKTLFCMPSFWADKTFICDDLNDIGKFDLQDENVVSIENMYEKDLPYMKMKSRREILLDESKKVLKINEYIRTKIANAKRNFVIYGTPEDYVMIHGWRAIKRHMESKIFLKNYSSYFSDKICQGEKFVYFPLHLQPEMTTDTLGGEYYDQLLAIEQLRDIVPRDWMIYVKENPKQKSYMRGKHFYDRLREIPNVRLVAKDVSTYDLMRECQFVATIVGTAGWEAISGGKPVLIFGNAWYKNFSGVTVYHEGVVIEDIMQNVDHDLLEKQVYALQKKTYPFWIDEYFRSLSSISDEDNGANMYYALHGKIEQICAQD